MSRQRQQRRFDGAELFIWYVVTGCVATVVGGVVGGVGLGVLSALGVGCRPAGGDVPPEGELACPDGTGRALPGLVLVGLGALAVVVTAAVLLGRRADTETIRRVARHVLWAPVLLVTLPGAVWITLLLASSAPPRTTAPVVVAVLAAVAFAAAPLLAAYRLRPARANLVLTGCLLVPVAVLALGRWLPLLVPVALPVAVLWAVALWLRRADGRADLAGSAGAPRTAP